MIFNRSKYDTCSYKLDLQGSVSTLGYVLNTDKFQNNKPAMHQLGFIGGNNVSLIKGDMVDLESELRGQTRILSKCQTNLYVPTDDNIIKNDKTNPIDTSKKHLDRTQSIMYRSIPLPPPLDIDNCK